MNAQFEVFMWFCGLAALGVLAELVFMLFVSELWAFFENVYKKRAAHFGECTTDSCENN